MNKETNEYPQICFQQDNTSLSDNIFALELSHMYSNMENIDIYSPILSGFFTKKILLSNSLGIYTHYSDIHFIKKIYFYLKKLKGDPIMYFVQCNNYPNCYNKIDEFVKNPNNAFKGISFGNYHFYSNISNVFCIFLIIFFAKILSTISTKKRCYFTSYFFINAGPDSSSFLLLAASISKSSFMSETPILLRPFL